MGDYADRFMEEALLTIEDEEYECHVCQNPIDHPPEDVMSCTTTGGKPHHTFHSEYDESNHDAKVDAMGDR